MLMGDINSNGNSSGVSVIICCYNSAARLSQTLVQLARQNIPQNLFLEIIPVTCQQVIRSPVQLKYGINLKRKIMNSKIINEPKPGQMYPGTRGVVKTGNYSRADLKNNK
jgi:hypothetical protein